MTVERTSYHVATSQSARVADRRVPRGLVIASNIAVGRCVQKYGGSSSGTAGRGGRRSGILCTNSTYDKKNERKGLGTHHDGRSSLFQSNES